MTRDRARYRFGPLERRGLIAGWRGGQIAAVAAGLVLAVLLLHGRVGVPEIAAAVLAVVAGVGAAWWPIAGRHPEEWAPIVVRWTVARASGDRRRRDGVAASGHCIGPDGEPCLVARRASTPARRRARPPARQGLWASLRMLELDAGDGRGRLGVVHDPRSRTYTATMRLLGHSFALLGWEEKERRVESWASVLSSLARDRAIAHRVQWIATTLPDDGAGVANYLEAHGVLPADGPPRRSYAQLLRTAGAATCRHDVLLAVQVRVAGPVARMVRSAGGGHRGACAVLARELRTLERQLASADVPVDGVLDARELASVVRRAGEAPPGRVGRCPPCGVGWPWPVAVDAEWSCVRTDAWWHATYWIAEWPRVDVGPEFLGPLLLGSVRRSVAVVMEPVAPGRAVRQAERARTADIADAELRRRGGFLATARRAREAELASRREEELADGHASYRFAGYVTVSAAARDELDAACDATEQAASQCRLELRRLYGDQERAFACTLPLARGLA